MTQPDTGRQLADDGAEGPVVRDRRRIDPETGEVRTPTAEATTGAGAAPADASGRVDGGVDGGLDSASQTAAPPADDEDAAAREVEPDLAAERLLDLQRLQAEYVNYRKRVERDRTVARDSAVSGVLESLLPVLDDVHLARQHGDLEGSPFAAVADKLEAVLARHGLERFGEVGEAFDPTVHEALMHTEAELAEGTDVTTVVQVLQPGYRAGERVLRPARVAVADPQ